MAISTIYSRKIKLAARLWELAIVAVDDPKIHEGALEGTESEEWKHEVKDNLDSIECYSTRIQIEMLPGTNVIQHKMVLKCKVDKHGCVARDKACVIEKIKV